MHRSAFQECLTRPARPGGLAFVAAESGHDRKPIGVRATNTIPGRRKLLDRLREALRSRHYSRRTEEASCHWVKRFIFFHYLRHPVEMAEPEKAGITWTNRWCKRP